MGALLLFYGHCFGLIVLQNRIVTRMLFYNYAMLFFMHLLNIYLRLFLGMYLFLFLLLYTHILRLHTITLFFDLFTWYRRRLRLSISIVLLASIVHPHDFLADVLDIRVHIGLEGLALK